MRSWHNVNGECPSPLWTQPIPLDRHRASIRSLLGGVRSPDQLGRDTHSCRVCSGHPPKPSYHILPTVRQVGPVIDTRVSNKRPSCTYPKVPQRPPQLESSFMPWPRLTRSRRSAGVVPFATEPCQV